MSPLYELNNADNLVGLLVVSPTTPLDQMHELTEVVWKSRGICIIRSYLDTFINVDLSIYEMHDISLALVYCTTVLTLLSLRIPLFYPG
jgi:hypothetical protein